MPDFCSRRYGKICDKYYVKFQKNKLAPFDTPLTWDLRYCIFLNQPCIASTSLDSSSLLNVTHLFYLIHTSDLQIQDNIKQLEVCLKNGRTYKIPLSNVSLRHFQTHQSFPISFNDSPLLDKASFCQSSSHHSCAIMNQFWTVFIVVFQHKVDLPRESLTSISISAHIT